LFTQSNILVDDKLDNFIIKVLPRQLS